VLVREACARLADRVEDGHPDTSPTEPDLEAVWRVYARKARTGPCRCLLGSRAQHVPQRRLVGGGRCRRRRGMVADRGSAGTVSVVDAEHSSGPSRWEEFHFRSVRGATWHLTQRVRLKRW
jgi:hypothetical protein